MTKEERLQKSIADNSRPILINRKVVPQVLLSILIPTVVGREAELHRITKKISGFGFTDEDMFTGRAGVYFGECQLYIIKDNKEMTIGEKRDQLYNAAEGLFSWQIDEDDDIADNAIQLILEDIKSNPEIPCIAFRERCMMNGVYKSSNHSIRYSQWMDNQDGFDYVRSPFYKDVIRTDIAKSVPFPKIRYNEDEQWAKALYPKLTSEIHIDQELYYYNYEPKDSHEERYGFISK